jgi:hypothetical protein
MSIKEIDAALDKFVDGVIVANDRYFYSIDEFVEHYMDEAACEDDLPETVNGTWKRLFDYCSAGDVAEGLWEDVVCHDFAPRKHRYWHNHHTAENLTNWALESLYSFCEDEMNWDNVNGLQDLQSALDVFRSLNQPIWLLTSRIKAYDPAKHSIGLKSLQKALNNAAMLNHHHLVYHYQESQSVKLTKEWWLDAGWECDEEVAL